MRRHPLPEELAHAALAVTLLLAVLTLAYHLITGNSPLPFVLGGALGFGAGIGVLVLTSPARRYRQRARVRWAVVDRAAPNVTQ